jgi:hypothetical protein
MLFVRRPSSVKRKRRPDSPVRDQTEGTPLSNSMLHKPAKARLVVDAAEVRRCKRYAMCAATARIRAARAFAAGASFQRLTPRESS